MSLPFMPMYWGDYWRDTTHLSDAEHVAYLRLISHYWQHGELPDDDARLARIAGKSKSKWAKMKPTIRAFFDQKKSDFWTHNRIEKELQKESAIRERFVERAKKAASVRWQSNQTVTEESQASVEVLNDAFSNPSSSATSMLQASDKQCLSNALHNHNHNHIDNLEITKKYIDRSAKKLMSDFVEFWSLYPRKIAKGAAEKSWLKAIRETDPKIIIDGLRAFKFSSDPQFIPHPATWLNQRRWEDGPPMKKMTLAEQYALSAFGDDIPKGIDFDGESNG